MTKIDIQYTIILTYFDWCKIGSCQICGVNIIDALEIETYHWN